MNENHVSLCIAKTQLETAIKLMPTEMSGIRNSVGKEEFGKVMLIISCYKQAVNRISKFLKRDQEEFDGLGNILKLYEISAALKVTIFRAEKALMQFAANLQAGHKNYSKRYSQEVEAVYQTKSQAEEAIELIKVIAQ